MQVETPGGVAPAGLPHWGGRAAGCNLWRLCHENRPPLGWPRLQVPTTLTGAAAGFASQAEDGEFFLSGAWGPADGAPPAANGPRALPTVTRSPPTGRSGGRLARERDCPTRFACEAPLRIYT